MPNGQPPKHPHTPTRSWVQTVFGGKLRKTGETKSPETENPQIHADLVYSEQTPKGIEQSPQNSPQNPQVGGDNEPKKSL